MTKRLLLITSGILFLFYLFSLPHTFVAVADATEFATAIATNGIAHPPGYPLYLLIGKITTLIPVNNKLWLINALSAFYGALTCYYISLIVFRLTKSFQSSLFSILVLGFSPLFWKYSIVSEVFTLNTLLASLLIYLSLVLEKSKGRTVLSVLIGLSLTNHQTIIFIFPLIVYIMWQKKLLPKSIKETVSSVLLFGIGLSPYLYLYILGKAHPFQVFGDTQTLQGLFDIFTRKVYGTFKLTAGDSLFNDPNLWQQIFDYTKFTVNQFTVFGILLGLLGVYFLLKRNKGLAFAIIFSYLLSGIIFFIFGKIYLGNPVYEPIAERFLILPNTILIIIIGIGHFGLFDLFKKMRVIKIATITTFIIPILIFQSNKERQNFIKDHFAPQIADDAFINTPQNSIMMITGDTPIPAIIYAHVIEKKRPDVAIIVPEFFKQKRSDWYYKHLNYFYPDIILPDKNLDYENLLVDFIKKNRSNRPIVYVGRLAQSKDGLPIPSKKVGIIGIFLESVPKTVDLIEVEKEIENTFGELKNTNPIVDYPVNSSESTNMDLYSRPYKFLAEAYEDSDDIDNAIRLYKKALSITSTNYPIYAKLAELYEKKGDKKTAHEMLSNYLKINPYEKDVPHLKEYINELR